MKNANEIKSVPLLFFQMLTFFCFTYCMSFIHVTYKFLKIFFFEKKELFLIYHQLLIACTPTLATIRTHCQASVNWSNKHKQIPKKYKNHSRKNVKKQQQGFNSVVSVEKDAFVPVSSPKNYYSSYHSDPFSGIWKLK
jgi:hypothetical protein